MTRGRWNYRVLRFKGDDGDTYHQIVEAHYGKGSEFPHSYGEAGLVSEEGLSGLAWILGKMQEALSEPVIDDVLFYKDKEPRE